MGLRFGILKEYQGDWKIIDDPQWDIAKIKEVYLGIVKDNLPTKDEYLNTIETGLPVKKIFQSKRYSADEVLKLVGETWDEMNKEIIVIANESWDELVELFKKESIRVR